MLVGSLLDVYGMAIKEVVSYQEFTLAEWADCSLKI